MKGNVRDMQEIPANIDKVDKQPHRLLGKLMRLSGGGEQLNVNCLMAVVITVNNQ